MSPGFNSFLLLRDEQNSKCGGLLAIIICIYLPPTYLEVKTFFGKSTPAIGSSIESNT
jgi:hypothetical protein